MNETIEKLQENIVPAQNQVFSVFNPYDDDKCGLKILFIGNSITLHRPKPELGWYNFCGMAASKLENDYVHQLMAKVRGVDEEAKYAINVTWDIETVFEDFEAEKFKRARDYEPDIIIMFFGANCPQDYKDRTDLKKTFSQACIELSEYVNPNKKAKVFWFQGFYIRPEIDAEKEIAAKYCGDKYCLLGDIPYREDTHGQLNHPGDLGMKMIAERMWQEISNDVEEIYNSKNNAR